MEALAMDRVCFGHVCHDARGLTLLHLPPEHVVLGAVLLVASFLFFYSLAWAWLHRLKGLPARVATFFVLSAGYMLLVLRGIPWHPYWIRELHVMTCCMFAWKALELALLRRHEALPGLPAFLLHDALVLRPEILQDPGIRRAKQLAAKAPLLRRIRNALPKLGWALVQYVGVELINVYLMQQPTDYHSLPVWRRFLLGALFAECLYLHLAYFFSCMCALNVVLFADAVEAWPEPFNRPFAATSPIDFWNRRWHGMFKWYFVQLVYRPVQSLIHATGKPSPLVKALPTMAVFLVSGLFHELLLYINFGKASGEQLAFFMIHAVVLVVQRYLEREAQGGQEGSDRPSRPPVGEKGAALKPNANSYGSLASCMPVGGSCGAAAQPAAPEVVHINAKTGAVGGVNGVGEGVQGEETEGSGDDGSCCGSGNSSQVAAAQQARGATCVVQRASKLGGKAAAGHGGVDAGGSVNGGGGGSGTSNGGAKGSSGIDGNGQSDGSGTGTGVGDAAAPGPSRPAVVGAVPGAAARGRRGGRGRRLLALLMGRPNEPLVLQYVRYLVQLVVFNTFLGFTLILFFSPWFRFGYHQELRVFVPGPVHHLARHLLSEWGVR